MAVLAALLQQVGGKALWRSPVLGHVVGNQDIDEALGIWYPSYQAFLDLMTALSPGENMRLRALALARADLHRCGASRHAQSARGAGALIARGAGARKRSEPRVSAIFLSRCATYRSGRLHLPRFRGRFNARFSSADVPGCRFVYGAAPGP
jgi:hypothetical protein